jgi:hypothetical protein
MEMKRIVSVIIPRKNALMQKVKYLFMAAAFLTFTSVCFADEGPGGPGEDNPDETTTPFDGGVSLLVAAGIGYGVKKAYDAKRKTAAAGVEEEATV